MVADITQSRAILKAWRPIIDPSGGLGLRARCAVDSIARALLAGDYPPPPHRHRHADRSFEEATLYGYLSLCDGDRSMFETAVSKLNSAGENPDVRPYALFGGLCGLGWTVEHLDRQLGTAGNDDALLRAPDDDESHTTDIDRIILNALSRTQWAGDYDLIAGLVGFGVYFLERLPARTAWQGIRLVMSHLESLANETDSGIWFTRPEMMPAKQRSFFPDGHYNLGVAHGVPGVIYFLNEVASLAEHYEEGWVPGPLAESLLERSVTWLLAQQRPPESCSLFSWSASSTSDSRLAWCYGDLGILAVLFPVVRRLGKPEWIEAAECILDHCLVWPIETSGVRDAMLCHGAAGVAHIFNRIYQASGDPRCRDAAVTWFEHALGMEQPGLGVAGFAAYSLDGDEASMVTRLNLLDGALGLALALLAATTSVAPQWDRMMLLSGLRDRDCGEMECSRCG